MNVMSLEVTPTLCVIPSHNQHEHYDRHKLVRFTKGPEMMYCNRYSKCIEYIYLINHWS
jgi:hypothetical protein